MSDPQPLRGACLVTGATGLLGGRVVAELLSAGATQVYVAVRPKAGRSAAQRFADLQAGHEPAERLQLLELPAAAQPSLPDSIRSIVHCAALVDFTAEEGILEANVGATWHLLCAAARLPHLERFMHIGSLTVRTDSDHDFTEADLDTGQSFVAPYTLTKFLTEVMIRKLHRDVPVTVVRAGSILPTGRDVGSETSDWFRTTVKLWAQGRLTAVPMAPEQSIYPVLAPDLARTLVSMLAYRHLPDVVHLPARPGPPARRIFELLADALGVDPPALLAQHGEQWRRHRDALPHLVRRVVDGLYPPPPPGRRLASVDSTATSTWLRTHGIASPAVDDAYWSELASSVAACRAAGAVKVAR